MLLLRHGWINWLGDQLAWNGALSQGTTLKLAEKLVERWHGDEVARGFIRYARDLSLAQNKQNQLGVSP